MTCKNLKYNASDKSLKTDKTKRSLTNKRMKNKETIKDLEENKTSPKEETDNPHDKGYKRIFSIKKNFLDFIKKYIAFDWMMELTEKDLELIDKEFITDQFDTYESDLVYKVNTKKRKRISVLPAGTSKLQ